MGTSLRLSSLVFVLVFQQIPQQAESILGTNFLERLTSDAAIYPGLKKTGLKLDFSQLGTFDDLDIIAKVEGFLKIGLFCVKKGAFILYRRPDFNIDNVEDMKIASGENRCFTPTGIASAQPLGPVHLPKKDSVTFFTQKNFASLAFPTARSITRSFFVSIRASIKSLIIIGKTKWTLVTAEGHQFCMKPIGFDDEEKHQICMLSEFSGTQIKLSGINIVRVVKGCFGVNTTIEVSVCTYWGAVPDVDGDGLKTMIEDEALAGRTAGECGSGGESDKKIKDTLYFLKNLLTGAYNKDVILDFNGITNVKWRLEILDIIWDIAKKAMPRSLVPPTYMHKLREYFVSELANAWRRTPETEEKDGNETLITGMGILTEYDYRSLLYQTNECKDLMNEEEQSKSNYAAWNSITNPNATEGQVWKDLLRKTGYNIVIEMTWVILNMVGGLCHKLFGYQHNYWALYIHFVVNMYLAPVADEEWIKPAELGFMDIILGGEMDIMYNKMAIFASLALFAANSLEPFHRPVKGNHTIIIPKAADSLAKLV